LNQVRSEIVDTYILKTGIALGRYSYATAVGFLQGIISFILLLSANFTSKRLTGEGFF
jgi:putative aldouronate transport system permease protein